MSTPDWATRAVAAASRELVGRYAGDRDPAPGMDEARCFVLIDDDVAGLREELVAGFAEEGDTEPERTAERLLAGFAAELEEAAARLPGRAFGARALRRAARAAARLPGPPPQEWEPPALRHARRALLGWRTAAAGLTVVAVALLFVRPPPEGVQRGDLPADESYLLALYRDAHLLEASDVLHPGDRVLLTCQALLRPDEVAPILSLTLTGVAEATLTLPCAATATGPEVTVVGPRHLALSVEGGVTRAWPVRP